MTVFSELTTTAYEQKKQAVINMLDDALYTTEEKKKARGIVDDMTAELLAGNKAMERAGHMKELGMGDQLPHPAPEMKNVQMDGRFALFLTNSAGFKLAGWIGNKKAGYEQDALALINAASMSKQSVPKLLTNSFSTAVYPTDAVDIAGGKVFDSNKAVFDLAKKVNDDIENRLNSGKAVPEGTLQRAVLRNIQTFAQDLKPFIDEAAWNKAKENLARIKEDFDKDLSGLSADEKAAHFLKLSKDMKEQNSFAGNFIKDEEARKKNGAQSPKIKISRIPIIPIMISCAS